MSAPISEVVSVSISLQAAGVTRQGFGTPLLAAYHTKYVDRVREYSDLSALVSDGFATTHPVYRAAAKILGQNPRPRTFKVGRRALPFTQKVNLIPTDTTVGRVYTITITTPAGVEEEASYAVVPSDTVALIIDGLKIAIDALGLDLTVTDNTTSMDILADNAGELFDYDLNDGPITFKNTTVDPGIATDLAAILLADPDWYGLLLDSNSEAEVATVSTGAAAWCESNKKMGFFDTMDSAVGTNSTTDIGSKIQDGAYTRTGLFFTANLLAYAGAAAMGKHFPTDPGRATLAHKTLGGVNPANLNTTQRGYLKDKRVNAYVEMGGVNVVLFGTAGSGYLDDARFIDYLGARIQENVFALLVNNDKLPFSDAGISAIKGEIKATLAREMPFAILADPPPTVTAPLASEVSSVDKGNRRLPDVEFTATIAGAIHEIEIQGKLVL